ncbi:MAG: transposase [Usitatibacter sp.]
MCTLRKTPRYEAMPRTARLRIPGVPLHIVQRGRSKQSCFFGTSEYELYLGLLQEFATPHGCAIHAYVLMTNHVHLLLTPADPHGFSDMMSIVNQRYGQRVNRTYGWSGSLWQGRFWSCPIESERYLFTCQRYVEMNPVRARLADYPAGYPWSSYAANAAGAASRLLTPHPLYLALGATTEERHAAYCGLFSTDLSVEEVARIRGASRSGRPLGSDEFLVRMGFRVGRSKPGPVPKAGRPHQQCLEVGATGFIL